jgi:hypothetical protein
MIMADEETVFNPLEVEVHEPVAGLGIKPAGAAMETHEATFADSHLIDLDLDHSALSVLIRRAKDRQCCRRIWALPAA